MEILLKHQFYRSSLKQQKELFDLELVFRQDTNQLILSSSVIPNWIIDEVFFAYEELLIDAPKFNHEKVNVVLADVAKSILKHPFSSKLYFPNEWLDDKGRVIKAHLGNLHECKAMLRIHEPKWLSRRSPYHIFILDSILWKACSGSAPENILKAKKVERNVWEKNLENEYQIDYYLSIYNEVASCIQVESNGIEPSFCAILDKRSHIIAAFLIHSKVIHE